MYLKMYPKDLINNEGRCAQAMNLEIHLEGSQTSIRFTDTKATKGLIMPSISFSTAPPVLLIHIPSPEKYLQKSDPGKWWLRMHRSINIANSEESYISLSWLCHFPAGKKIRKITLTKSDPLPLRIRTFSSPTVQHALYAVYRSLSFHSLHPL